MPIDVFVDPVGPGKEQGDTLEVTVVEHAADLPVISSDLVVAFSPNPLPQRQMFGLAFSSLTFADTLEEIALRAAARHGTVVMTCNVDHVVLLSRDEEFARAYDGAHIITADGAPLIAFSRVARRPLPERVTGADIVAGLATIAGEHRLRVALVGGAEGVAAQAAERFAEQSPGLAAPLAICPPMGFALGSPEDDQLIAALQEYDPHIVVVCLGAPRQEIWMNDHLADLPRSVLIGGGAALDFVVGRQRRAPRWVQRSGFEWVWRLTHDFRRLAHRYLVQDAAIVTLMARELLHPSTRVDVPA